MTRDIGGVDVRGGVGGTTVGLEALDEAARALAGCATEVAGVMGRVLLAAGDPVLGVSAPLSPATAARAEASLAFAVGPARLGGQAALLTALAAATAAATAAYRERDAEVARTMSLAQDAAMFAVGRCAPQVVVGVLALEALGVDVPALLDRAVYARPWLADLGGGADGLVLGLSVDPWTGAALVPGLVRRLAPGQEEPGGHYEEALRTLGDAAGFWGLLRDDGRAVVAQEDRPRAGAVAPTSLVTLVSDQAALGDGARYPGHVRVVEVPQPDGSAAWVVEISGTQVWDPRAGDNPFDVTTDVRLMAHESTVLAAGVEQALDTAQRLTGRDTTAEPVLLAGHSLGGIVAGGLASSPRFTANHHVTHVVTTGSPIARMPVATGVQVLSLEHRQDPVPRLEGEANPDRRDWVTVTRDLDDAAGGGRTAGSAHGLGGYIETAGDVDASTDPSLAQWRRGSQQFFTAADGREPVLRDFRIARSADLG